MSFISFNHLLDGEMYEVSMLNGQALRLTSRLKTEVFKVCGDEVVYGSKHGDSVTMKVCQVDQLRARHLFEGDFPAWQPAPTDMNYEELLCFGES